MATKKPTLKRIRELERRIQKLELGLRIIRTWATCDDPAFCSREKAMRDIRDRADETLKDDSVDPPETTR